MNKNHILKYNKPADTSVWEEALPLGNGFVGAMVFSGVSEELVMLNQESVWFGGKRDRINPDALEALPGIREAVFRGELSKAEELEYTKMFGTPFSQGHYEPLANLRLIFYPDIPHYSEAGKEQITGYESYSRELDLTEAVHSCSYQHEGTCYRREMFISYPDDVMAIKLTAAGKRKLSFRAELERGDMAEKVAAGSDGSLVLEGASGGGGPKFTAALKVVVRSGSVERAGETLKIRDADEAVIFLAATTDFYGHKPYDWCMSALDGACGLGYDKVKARHLEDYKKLYERVSLDLGGEENLAPTDIRLNDFSAESPDTGFVELYFNYGRYLLISCSREGSLPANLQGIWNKEMQPPWGSKYTININTEMNYWPAEVTNLSECHTPLFDHLLRMEESGSKVAGDMYGCRGVAAHHNTDIYGDCAPQDKWMPATIWPMGIAWLTTHMIEHYRFTGDMKFAKKHYSFIKKACVFFLDYLVEKEGELVTCPSTSPENTYILENGQKSAVCYGPTMDSQIIRHLWGGFLRIAEALSDNDRDVCDIAEKISRLPKEKIGSHGQILEWTKEYEEWEKGHRHISHLYGLHPGASITKSLTPDVFEAAKTTLKERLSYGGGHTGWSRAWIINFYARLYEGNTAYENICALFKKSTASNLFDMHPPFQIDGNFGAAAGIAEMLVQSHEDFIRLLPALPDKWQNGHVTGLKARNNIEVSIWWESGALIKAVLLSPVAQHVKVSYQDKEETIKLVKNEKYEYKI